MSGEQLFKLGMQQVAEWASSYVMGETCIPETPMDKLSEQEKAGLIVLHMMEKSK